jgi:hypothetical protein
MVILLNETNTFIYQILNARYSMNTDLIRNNIKLMQKIQEEVNKQNGVLFNLCISGSHLYGFESEDSDVDYRGTFVLNTNNFLTMERPIDVIEFNHDGNDVVLFEIKKEMGLALRGNCNIIEHINCKQIYNTARFVEFRQLINNSYGKKGLYDSYSGMATFNYKKFILQGKRTYKKYLYVMRGLMAGIYVLQTGQIEPNIDKLNEYFKIPEVKELIRMKKSGLEFDVCKEFLDGSLEKVIDELFERMDKAYEKSKIQDEPDDDDKKNANAFLLKIRKENFGD